MTNGNILYDIWQTRIFIAKSQNVSIQYKLSAYGQIYKVNLTLTSWKIKKKKKLCIKNYMDE